MSRLYKKERITVRMSSEQLGRLDRAAKIESRRRGEAVEPSQLFRETAMRGVDEIIATEEVKATT